MPFTQENIKAGIAHLRQSDATMKAIIRRVGPFTLQIRRQRFHMLVRSIVSQQISVAAARTILGRLEALVYPGKIEPGVFAAYTVEDLRAAGVSRQKATYMLDLAQKVHSGDVRLARIGQLDDESVIDELTQIKGIGRWTAQMFLIFSLGRLDVLPVDDLGLRNAIRQHYGFDAMPRPAECEEIGAAWRPYATIASWYCWRSLE